MTTSAWLLQFQGLLNRWVVPLKKFHKHNCHPSTSSQFHLASQTLSSYAPLSDAWMHMNWYILASGQVSLLALWSFMDLMGVIVFWIGLITCSMNPGTAVTFTCGHFNQVVLAVYLLGRRTVIDTIWQFFQTKQGKYVKTRITITYTLRVFQYAHVGR